jgi:uncharacterized membrane protein YozB (DUF420 family)
MYDLLEGSGFLPWGGSLGADLTLLVSLAAFAALTAGVVLAKKKRFAAHRWVQTCAAGLNTVPVIAWMGRSFRLHVVPELPGALRDGAYLVTTSHAAVGLLGLVLGLAVVARANQLEARGDSLSSYVLPMRAAYLMYLIGTATGVWVYAAIYG